MAVGKRELAKAVRDGAAGILEAMDLDALLGDDIFDQIIEHQDLQEYATQKQMELAKKMRGSNG